MTDDEVRSVFTRLQRLEIHMGEKERKISQLEEKICELEKELTVVEFVVQMWKPLGN